MTYQVDVWAGDCHQRHVETFHSPDWDIVQRFMMDRVEAGLLCNVLHTDFKTPENRVSEVNEALINEYLNKG